MEVVKFTESDFSNLLQYVDEIKERLIYRLQQEFPQKHDLVQRIIEEQMENIYDKAQLLFGQEI